jgi:hypothetical protein
MTQAAVFSVVQLGEWPATRGLGQEGQARLDDLLGEREDIDLVIDFAGVQVMNISFADEFLGKFLASHDFSARGTTVRIAGLNADSRSTPRAGPQADSLGRQCIQKLCAS